MCLNAKRKMSSVFPALRGFRRHNSIKINVNFRIIPFGHVSIEVKGREEEKETREREKESPVYLEPKTTNPQLIEITFGGENYTVPKTTDGFL